ncbi:aminotransferase [Clostridia bacterium]|nr:aminotransferase [Clostridia bacterium]
MEAKPLSKIASAVRASTTITIDALYKKMLADGEDVIGFGAGEPDFNTPEFIKDAGIAAIHNNVTRYTPAAGTLSLRRAICNRLKADYDVDYEPSQIVVASGAKHNLYIALATLCDPGDEVILPAPYWVSYDEQIRMVGATTVEVHATAQHDFKMTAAQLEAAITPRTKALILNSPSNPTGMVYHRDELRAIADVCVARGIWIISDEIYSHLVYGGCKFYSFASLGEQVKEHTILINGVSKSYAMTGWRVGFAAAPQNAATAMSNFQSHSTSAPCSIAQAAAETALSGDQSKVEDMRRVFQRRRDLFLELAAKIPGVSCRKPEGAFYVLMDVSQSFGKTIGGTVIADADDFARLLLERSLVAVVPCGGFAAPNCVRMSYAVADSVLVEGLKRLDSFMREVV